MAKLQAFFLVRIIAAQQRVDFGDENFQIERFLDKVVAAHINRP